MLRKLGAIGLMLVVGACAKEIERPSPSVGALDPSLACGEQLTTSIRVSGSGLAPLPVDVLGRPGLELPDLWLQRTTDLTGVSGAAQEVVDLDESAGGGRARWYSQGHLEFDIYPEQELLPGLYDVYARNADGQTAHLPGALTIVPRPLDTMDFTNF
jgi:hypothetical protein